MVKVGNVRAGSKKIKYEYVEDTLGTYQDAVGGLIEHVSLTPELGLYLNEEGKIFDLEPSLLITKEGEALDVIAGNCLFVKADDEGRNISLTQEDEDYIEDHIAYDEDMEILEYKL